MKGKDLIRKVSKSKRFLPADLDEIEVIISKNNKGIAFYFIKEERILHKFTLTDGD